MSDVRVTALMPLKGFQSRFLRSAVESLLAQTSPAWHLIVVVDEDGESPDPRAVLSDALADPRVELVENEGRKLSGALNTGLRRARTDFAAILHGDDLWTHEAVAVLTRWIERRPDVDFFHSARSYVDDDDRPISSTYPPQERFDVAEFARHSPIKHLLCFRREAALAIGGFDETLNSVGPDDYDFPWSMAEAGYRFQAIPDCLYVYRDHRTGYRLTTHIPRSTHVRELRRILRKHGVGRLTVERAVAQARDGYLKQCIFRSRVDRWLKEHRRRRPRSYWRETYR